MDTLIALLSAFTAAAYFVYVSSLMKARRNLPSGTVLAVGHMVAAMALLPFAMQVNLGLLLTPDLTAPLVFAALLLVISRQLYYYAYARTDVAHITVFSALTPVYALGAGYFMLGEVPTLHALLGLTLICGGVYAVFMTRDTSLSLIRNMIMPFMAIARSRPVACAFLSTIPTAFAAAYQKQLMASLDPVTFSLGLLLIIGLVSSAIELCRQPIHILKAQIHALPWHFYVASATLMPATHILFCLVIQTQQTAISLVLQRSAIVFQILLAYLLLKEQRDIRKRLLAALVIMSGFMMIMWNA